MNHLDLFSGIGGFSLGLESVGFETVAFCEIEDYPRRVLNKHWPNVPCYEDVRDVGAKRLATDGIGRIDIVTGGFPCQDISLAGARAGLSGERSGLWSELYRVIAEVRPRWAIVENVPGLRTLGADRVLADLAGAGYAAWPMVVGAGIAGAPHRRQRVWIVAHTQHGGGRRFESERGQERRNPELAGNGEERIVAYAIGERCGKAGARELEPYGQDVPHAKRHQLRQEQGRGESERTGAAESGDDGEGRYAADATNRKRDGGTASQSGCDTGWTGTTRQSNGQSARGHHSLATGREQWDWANAPEPVLRGVDDGLPCASHRRERLKALGNAVVPQVVAAIGRAILQADQICTKD